jgi:thiol-disulfide isomerase/thioredoxin
MKRWGILLFIFYSISLDAQKDNRIDKFVLTGKLIGQDTGLILLNYIDKNEKFISDTASLINGNFFFSGFINEPTSAYINGNIKSNSVDDVNTANIFLEAATMTAILKVNEFKKAKITGSHSQDEMDLLKIKKAPILKEMEPLEKEYREIIKKLQQNKGNKNLRAQAAIVQEKLLPYKNRMRRTEIEFIANHPESFVSAYLMQFHVSVLPLDSIKMFYKKLNYSIKNSYFGKIVAKEIHRIESGSPGSTAEDFTANDIEGKVLNLSSFKGKSYVLLDFWASWCIPCRNSNPHLIQLYNKYHSKGLDVIGIAQDDNNKEAWKKAVNQDAIGIWHHILQGFDLEKLKKGEPNENDIGEKFGINSLPTKILIDKRGVIIGRYTGTEEEADLDKKLSEVFK